MMHIFEKYHSYIFALLSVAGFEMAMVLVQYSPQIIVFMYLVVFLFLFLLEASISFRYRERLKMNLPLPHIADEVRHIHLSHHLLLPLALFVSVAAFTFFNGISWSSELIILLGGVTFFSIFEGQRASFKNDFIYSETLHYIYDSIKIIIFFLGIDSIIQAQVYFGYGAIVSFILAEILSFILFILIIVRKGQFNTAGMLYIFFASLIAAIMTIILIPLFSPILAAIISAVIFYLLVGIIHHKLHATLTFPVIMEYLVIAAIIILAIKGISL